MHHSSTSFSLKEESRKEENWQCKTQRYTGLFQPGNKARADQKEKFSWSQYNNYRLVM